MDFDSFENCYNVGSLFNLTILEGVGVKINSNWHVDRALPEVMIVIIHTI